MDKITALEEAIKLLGGVNGLARRIGASPARVSLWVKRGSGAPADFCPEIELQTNGVVRCERLRPEVNWSYLRGTSKDYSSNTAPQ